MSDYLKSIKAISSIDQRDSQDSIYAQKRALSPGLALLRQWQVNRLAGTYSDLIKKPRYTRAAKFFMNDIYAPKDFSQRDNDLEYLYDVMSSVLPRFLLTLVENTVELNNLSNLLDRKLLEAMENDLNLKDEITPEMYTEAYRICDNYDDRALQIALILEIGRQVDFSTRIPLVGTALRLAGGPAKRSGWGDVHDFLERGYNAFKRMKGANEFLSTVKRREMYILDRIFEGDPNPIDTVPE